MFSGKEWFEKGHTLVVDRWSDEDGWEGADYQIVHPDCKKEVVWTDPDGKEIESFTCAVQYVVDYSGYEDIEGWETLPTGEYPIEFYGYTPYSMYEDSEAYIYIALDNTPSV